ncbi:hypothetical protein NHH73_03295 [Oxalobacteraceae bacterium OTU3CINTB1]|nr:hypothetical protein NHH73_03295 [Oxalobacteraceae bacterium OTU3CINTB1]
MFYLTTYLSDETIRDICKNLYVSIDENPILSDRSKSILKSVEYSPADLKKIVAALAKERVTDGVRFDLHAPGEFREF